MTLPHFVIVGAMKSATSTLQMQLAAQPGIFMSTPKEPNFFSDDPQFERGLAWYSALFAYAKPGDLVGEASTHYTKLPTYPRTVVRIKEHLPKARFIYVMRHPVDRLVSHYMHEWSMGKYRCGIQDAVMRYPELVSYGLYAMQLKPYFDTFGRDAVLPVFFDRLTRKPQAELERVCRFIGYQGTPAWSHELERRNVSSERIRRFPFYGIVIDSAPATWVRHNFIPKAMRGAVRGWLTMRQRPILGEDVQTRLTREFDRDLAELGAWLGHPLGCANFKEATAASELNWAASGRIRLTSP